MKHLEELISELGQALPTDFGGIADGVQVETTNVDLVLPVETYVDGGGLVRASLPRGRLATGWDPMHSRLKLGYARLARESMPFEGVVDQGESP